MSALGNVIETLPDAGITLESYDRQGHCVRKVDGRELVDWALSFRGAFGGWDDSGRKVVALLFRSEETIEFLAASFAALAQGFTVVPLYPNWSADTQRQYLEAYRLRAVAAGPGLLSRAQGWVGSVIDRVIPVDVSGPRPTLPPGHSRLRLELPASHPAAWIFTSGTSGALAKLTEITRQNLDAAIENIQSLDFLHEGMTLHTPLSASHIFAFVVILGFLAVRPRRILFSDVQYLARLPEQKTGKISGLILVPIVMNRMRDAFYEKLTARLRPATAPPELRALARIPLRLRRLLKRILLRAEEAVLRHESTGRIGPTDWAAIRLIRRLFGRQFRPRLGSPDFVVVGGAKPSLPAMAFLEVLGIRCLQGWGMTETTGPLCVCTLADRFRGAFGTCGRLFPQTKGHVEEGELVVEGPQIASGYHQPDGTFQPFHGKKRTGDYAEFDPQGRLRVLGKASDRITTDNGLNYNPIPLEEDLRRRDIEGRHLFEELVIIGDGQPRLGAVFFVREREYGGENGGEGGIGGVPGGKAMRREAEAYAEELVLAYNRDHGVDEQLAVWSVSPRPFRECGLLGPSGKLVRRRVEEGFAPIFERFAVAAP